MSRLKLFLLLFSTIYVCSCAEFRPFEDRYREPGTEYIYKGSSKPSSPAICYNPLFYDKNKIDAIADKLCKLHNPNSNARFNKKEVFSCRLLVPTKAFYNCVVDK